MKKILVSIVAVMMTAMFVFAGCSSKDKDAEASASADASAATEESADAGEEDAAE